MSTRCEHGSQPSAVAAGVRYLYQSLFGERKKTTFYLHALITAGRLLRYFLEADGLTLGPMKNLQYYCLQNAIFCDKLLLKAD